MWAVWYFSTRHDGFVSEFIKDLTELTDLPSS